MRWSRRTAHDIRLGLDGRERCVLLVRCLPLRLALLLVLLGQDDVNHVALGIADDLPESDGWRGRVLARCRGARRGSRIPRGRERAGVGEGDAREQA